MLQTSWCLKVRVKLFGECSVAISASKNMFTTVNKVCHFWPVVKRTQLMTHTTEYCTCSLRSTSDNHLSASQHIKSVMSNSRLAVSDDGFQLIKQLLCVDLSTTPGTALRNMCSGSGRLNESGGTRRYCQTSFAATQASRSFRRCCSFAITFSCTAHKSRSSLHLQLTS